MWQTVCRCAFPTDPLVSHQRVVQGRLNVLHGLPASPSENWKVCPFLALSAHRRTTDHLEGSRARDTSAFEVAESLSGWYAGPQLPCSGCQEPQPRPNVIFEAGLALGRHPGKTLLIQVGSIRGFSDIAGKHLVRLTDDVAKKKDVAARLGTVGCKVGLGGDDWMRPHGLTPKP